MIEVLIIEDDQRIADIHKRFIEKVEGFQVAGLAHTGSEAKDWIQSLQPQLILLDVYLPDMKGTELLSYIQKHSPDSDVIFITAASETAVVRKALRSGATDYMLKPLTFERFKDSLLSYLAKRHALETANAMNEESIQFLWNKTAGRAADNTMTPKGIDPNTMAKIREKLADSPGGVTAEEMGAACGMSRSTARRYLEFLVTEQKAYAELLYGTIGRPERRYFPYA